MKIKIIDKGGYHFGGTLKLPIVVEAVSDGYDGFEVKGSELIKHCADCVIISHGFDYVFCREHVEVVHTARVVEEAEVVPVAQCKAIRQGDQMQCVCGLAWDVDDTDLPECRA